jgi:hypothetical protein
MFRTRRAIIARRLRATYMGTQLSKIKRSLPPIPRTVSSFGRTDRTQRLELTAPIGAGLYRRTFQKLEEISGQVLRTRRCSSA